MSDVITSNFGVENKDRQWVEVYTSHYTVSQKNVPLCDCPYLRQILTNFQNFFTQ